RTFLRGVGGAADGGGPHGAGKVRAKGGGGGGGGGPYRGPGGERPPQDDGEGQEDLRGRGAPGPRSDPEDHRPVHREGRRAAQEEGAGDFVILAFREMTIA